MPIYRDEVALVLSKNGVQKMHAILSESDTTEDARKDFYDLLSYAKHSIHEESGAELWYWDWNTWFNDDIMPWIDYIFSRINADEYHFIWIESECKHIYIRGKFKNPFIEGVAYTIALKYPVTECLFCPKTSKLS